MNPSSMLKTHLRLLATLALLLGINSTLHAQKNAPENKADKDGYFSLFNGKDLTGWDGNPELWSVEGGLLTGQTDGKLKYNQFLTWTGGSVEDFELKVEFRLEGNNNSGVQYRSKLLPNVGPWSVGGYQADIHSNAPYTGMLYEERGRGIVATRGEKVVIDNAGKKTVTRLPGDFPGVDLTQWHELTIICSGTHIIHKLDGVTIMDLVDDEAAKHSLSGIIALQLHAGPPSKAQFRNIRLKNLKPDSKKQSQVSPSAPAPGKIPGVVPAAKLNAKADFQVELLYSASQNIQGEWGAICSDPQGRLIVSADSGGLFRITPAGLNGALETRVESIKIPLGDAQGLLYAFDSLYVVVNSPKKYDSGVYRVRDTTGDDQFDSVELLRALNGKGKHGPQAAILSPAGDAIYILCGNMTKIPALAGTQVPGIWDEDALLPRVHGQGFLKETPAPGGFIAKMSPDGQQWELLTVGFQNPLDAAFNGDGELFAFDSEMKSDAGTPWSQPTRLLQVLSGTDYGWRSGSARLLPYYADTLPPVLNMENSTAAGVCFGHHAKFPARYQRALFACDQSGSKLYAVHLEPQGAGYHGVREEFLTGTSLPLRDVIINPVDGAMYVTVGGQETPSALYRLTYLGAESTIATDLTNQKGYAERETLRKLQALHFPDQPHAITEAWSFLGDPDPIIRAAARTAIEFRPAEEWVGKALNEENVQARLEALLALCRVQERMSRNPTAAVDTPAPDWNEYLGESFSSKGIMQIGILTSLGGLGWSNFTFEQRVQGLRIVQLTILRYGQPEPQVRTALLDALSDSLPARRPEINHMLLEILVYLQDPTAAEKGVALIKQAASQKDQINYAKSLAHLTAGWTPELRDEYIKWIANASQFSDDNFERYVKEIEATVLSRFTAAELEQLKPSLIPRQQQN